MRQVTDYKIVCAVDHKELGVKVCDALEDGWEPAGGVCYNSSTGKMYQALIRMSSNDWISHAHVGGPG